MINDLLGSCWSLPLQAVLINKTVDAKVGCWCGQYVVIRHFGRVELRHDSNPGFPVHHAYAITNQPYPLPGVRDFLDGSEQVNRDSIFKWDAFFFFFVYLFFYCI